MRGVRSALLLAGGRSTRMGVDKAMLSWRGQPLWWRQVERLMEAGAEEVMIACREEQGLVLPEGREAERCQLVYDSAAEGDGRMMSALAGGLERLSEAALVLAVDLPCVTVDFLAAMRRRAEEGGCGVLLRTDRWQPLVGVYTAAMSDDLRKKRLGEKWPSLQACCGVWVAEGLAREWSVSGDRAALLANCNTPEEWAAIRELG